MPPVPGRGWSKPNSGNWRTRRVPGSYCQARRFSAVVGGVRGDGDAALFALGKLHLGDGVGRHIAHRLADFSRVVGRCQVAQLVTAEGDGAVGQHVGRVGNVLLGIGARGQHRVPERLEAILGNGEADGATQALDALTIGHHFCRRRILLDGRAHLVAVAEVTVPLVDGDLHGLGVLLEHGLLARTELVGVLFDIGRRDDEQRLFVGINVHRMLAAVGLCRTPGGAPNHLPVNSGIVPSLLPALIAPTQVKSLPKRSASLADTLAWADTATISPTATASGVFPITRFINVS